MPGQNEASILIVDDSPINLRLLTQVLEDRGYRVRIANNGQRALDAVKSSPPDLILLDILMPEMTGYQVCEQLKSHPFTREIPVIFISALDATEDKINAFSVGGVDYVTKPFQFEEVLARVQTHLAMRALQKSLQEKNLQLEREIAERQNAEEMLRRYASDLEAEKQKADTLLLNILPMSVAHDLKETGQTLPRTYENVTVFFSDIVGFTSLSSWLEPSVLISRLNEMFTAFDNIMAKNSCERIKTSGDAYLAVCGMPEENENHAANIVKSAVEIIAYLNKCNEHTPVAWQVRIGIHSGPVVGGVVGIKKYIYDVFGDTINTAARMESYSEPMRINISESTWRLVKDQFQITEREAIDVKGKGRTRMYFLEGPK